ncbi:diguanylate cyclase [Klebsiella grimontii]|uniref:diguanylate cyclase n=1 Tax=Klebsiella grimontii TaxID=2058152 RepID=A0A7H4P5S1_9ENTR|nr:diguanylate cyclase [Klebsiella grimontii]
MRNALLEKALFDSLTGLRNRHHLDDALHTQMNLAVRNGTPLSCLMIDIDHFKAINDSYGHEAGDLVIKSVARLFNARWRDIGMAFRYGGEEFLVLLGGTDEQTAMVCGERYL